MLQTLSAIGKEFSWSLLKHVVGKPEEALPGLLSHLQAFDTKDLQEAGALLAELSCGCSVAVWSSSPSTSLQPRLIQDGTLTPYERESLAAVRWCHTRSWPPLALPPSRGDRQSMLPQFLTSQKIATAPK